MDKHEVTKIAEKVRFWEEQDRINKAMIPRVLKTHDLIADLTTNIGGYSEKIIELEQKNSELSNKYELAIKRLEECEQRIEKYLIQEKDVNKIQSPQPIQWAPMVIASISFLVAIIALLT